MLDHEHKVLIGQVIRTIADKRTVVIASHDSYLREMADTAVELNEGKIVDRSSLLTQDACRRAIQVGPGLAGFIENHELDY
jgi:ABC-type transport system involved in cytochrome bd biosynthesis fused ATPase/permease subunit